MLVLAQNTLMLRLCSGLMPAAQRRCRWFIDAHLHIESSMMTPVTFETATLPRGLTTVICDPHEIVNVMGEAGFASVCPLCRTGKAKPILAGQLLRTRPEGCDVNGASFTLEQMLAWRDHPQVTGLAEMMDYPRRN